MTISSASVNNSGLVQLPTAVEHSTKVQKKHSSTGNTDEQISDGEIDGHIMDRSCSDVDKPELSLYSPRSTSEVRDSSALVDDDENYEPPSEISLTQRQEPDPDAVQLYGDLKLVEATLPAKKQTQHSADQGVELEDNHISGDPFSTASDNIVSDDHSRQSPTRSPFPANASDPDEYEPPEPAPLGEDTTQPIRVSKVVDSGKPFFPSGVESNNSVPRANWDSMPAVHQEVSVDAIDVEAGSHSGKHLPTSPMLADTI